ncbi:spermine oxidase [Halyomorpha halys]|uniref:spermine oxidase n=1 Tax=Halyomorpha halys TaxID=286706 RepID=UPI0006D526D2|nr:spermine oxidase [Halyomorpha halys]
MARMNINFRRFSRSAISRYAMSKANEKLKEKEEGEPPFCLEERCLVKPNCGCPKIVVIGGGLAGLSAAEMLCRCGLRDVTVLEGSNRLGGRITSCWLGDAAVELGCGQVGGGLNIANPLFSLALEISEGEIDRIFKVRAPEPTLFLTTDGNHIKDYEAESLLFKHILREATSLGEKTSLLHFLTLRINQELLNYPEEEKYTAERVLFGMANELKGQWGGDLNNVSAPTIGIKKEISGPSVVVQTGMLSLLAPIVNLIPFHRIFLEKEVVKIEWSGELAECEPRARIYTADYSCYEADYVIITLPLGVMKDRAAQMFHPPLPQSKIEALNAMGNGIMNKLYVAYVEPWWGGAGCRIRLGLSPHEIAENGDWTRGICRIIASSRSVMEIRIVGNEALMLEQCSEEEIALEVTRFFRKLLSDNTIPFPDHIIVARWGSNALCRGSSMYLTMNTTEEHIEEMKTPVPESPVPVLFFAGDSTDPVYFNNIAGARLSGLREAERVLELTRKFDGPPRKKE